MLSYLETIPPVYTIFFFFFHLRKKKNLSFWGQKTKKSSVNPFWDSRSLKNVLKVRGYKLEMTKEPQKGKDNLKR